MVTKSVELGDTVEIEWGPGDVKGQVVIVYGDSGSSHRHVVVEVPLHDAFGEVVASSTASVRESDIKKVLRTSSSK